MPCLLVVLLVLHMNIIHFVLLTMVDCLFVGIDACILVYFMPIYMIYCI